MFRRITDSLICSMMWIHLLRFPLLIALVAAVLPAVVLADMGPAALVRGAYEAGAMGFGFLVMISGFLAGSFVENTLLVATYGPQRFDLPEDGRQMPRWLGIAVRFLYFAGLALGIVVCLMLRAESHHSLNRQPGDPAGAPDSWLLYVIGGLVGGALPLWVHRFTEKLQGRWIPQSLMSGAATLMASLGGEGYLDKHQQVQRGHLRAALFACASWISFAACAWLPPQAAPPILFVLVLLLALSWLLSSLAFFLDRHRVPLFLIVTFWLMVGPNLWRADYSYDSPPVPEEDQGKELPSAAEVLGEQASSTAGEKTVKYSGLAMAPVCVAAVGGGIHSGSWEVEVLTRLQEIAGCETLADRIKVLSGTSGGAYGSMHYVNAMYPYEAGRSREQQKILDQKLRDVVQSSSLGSVVKALTYHDLLGYALPVLWGEDRGRAMETAWVANARVFAQDTQPSRPFPHLGKATLWDWAKNLGGAAHKATMPALLCKSGTEESGRPIIYGSSRVSDWNFNAEQHGVQPTGGSFPTLTVHAVTGARLSATFPWISPAARPDPALKTRRAEHQLDGGYYDNYGIAALDEWLDDGLKTIFGTSSPQLNNQEKKTPTILVIQIRYSSDDNPPKTMPEGFFSQLAAPLFGLYNSRTAAQQLRADEYFDVFARYWESRGVRVINAAFKFSGSAPLSWHLTQSEKEALSREGEKIEVQFKEYRDGIQSTKDAVEKARTMPDGVERTLALSQALANLSKFEKDHALGSAAWLVKEFLK